MRSFFVALVALLAAPVLCHADARYPDEQQFNAAVHHPVTHMRVAQATTNKPTGKVVVVAAAAATTTTPAPARATPAVGALPSGVACPTAGTLTTAQAQQNPFCLLIQFSTVDLQDALNDANAQTCPATTPGGSPTPCPDTVGATCYSGILALKQSPALALPQSGQIVGVFTAIQKARDLKTLLANMASPNGPLSQLNQACAAWTQDNIATLVAIGGVAGLVANPGGASVVAAGAGSALLLQMQNFFALFPK